MSKILYCRSFGLGNAICSIPTIKALYYSGHEVDVLVGSGPDDGGSAYIFNILKNNIPGIINEIHVDQVNLSTIYDIAVLAIPFHGNWTNGFHFSAVKTLDGRPRPSGGLGFSSWEKHESLYQLEAVEHLLSSSRNCDPWFGIGGILNRNYTHNNVYVGVGYKKDVNNYWSQKHFGNEKFAKLIKLLLTDSKIMIRMSGDIADHVNSIKPIISMLSDDEKKRVIVSPSFHLKGAFDEIEKCETYIGNDTGMMHVAASAGLNVVAHFSNKLNNSWTKSSPLAKKSEILISNDNTTPEEFYDLFRKVHYGENSKT